MRSAHRPQLVFFRCRQGQGSAVVHRRLAHVQLFLALQVQFNRRLETLIHPAHRYEYILGRQILTQPQRLPFGVIPRQPQPGQIGLDPLDIFFF